MHLMRMVLAKNVNVKRLGHDGKLIWTKYAVDLIRYILQDNYTTCSRCRKIECIHT